MTTPHTLFISDLHLDKDRPDILNLFIDFLQHQAPAADALYILGDLFEYWIGDDQPTTGLEPVIEAMASLKNQTPIFFIHGNRDFLIGKQFSLQTGMKCLPETTIIEIYGKSILLLHGDSLCTDDHEYQAMRAMFRQPQWQEEFLSLSIEARIKQALALRDKSRYETREKSENIMDVNRATVEQTFLEHNIHAMIHGHTHRPAIHEMEIAGELRLRIVLGDWYDQGSVLKVTANDYALETIKQN